MLSNITSEEYGLQGARAWKKQGIQPGAASAASLKPALLKRAT